MPTDQMNDPPKLSNINARTHDLTEIRVILREMIAGMNEGPKSRCRSLVITKLEEAGLWAGEALFAE